MLTSNAASPTRGSWPGVILNAGAAGSVIENAVIDWASQGVRVNGVAVTIRNSTIRNFPSNAGTGVYVAGSGASGTLIEGNTIRGVNDQGRCIVAEDSSPTITANTLSDSDRAVYAWRISSPTIARNIITSNDNGIYVDGVGTSPQPVATNNQIFANDEWNYFVTGYATGAQNLKLDATGNWWGTTSLTTISGTISDYNDSHTSTTLPSVNFASPLLSAGGSPATGNYMIGPLQATTTLTAGATYEVLGPLHIPAGRSLTIPAGTRLRFYTAASVVLVDGTLTVQGAQGNLAQLISGRPTPSRNDWAGIQVRAEGTASFDYAHVEWAATAIRTTNVPITVRNSIIRNFTSSAGTGVLVSGSGASGSQIVGNTITGMNDEGRCVVAEDSSPTISNNSMTNCDRGVLVYRSSSPTITGNTIAGNDIGISVDGAGVSPAPIATGNQISANDTWNYIAANFATGAQNLRLNATGNWWGTTDIRSIAELISDWSDSPTSTTIPNVNVGGLLDGAGGNASSANFISGPLAANTTLTGGAIYQVPGVLQIPAGRTLTVPAGTRLNFYTPSGSLIVDGTLTVQGSSGNLVQFTSGRANPSRTDWGGIQIRAGANAFIEYALIEWASVGVKVTGVAATIGNSTIRNFTSNSGAGVWVSGSAASGTQIVGNTITGVDDEGRCIYAEDSSPTISNNTLTNCDRGVSVYRSSSPTITGNTITSNDNGIYVDGVGVNPAPVVNGNQILANDVWNFAAANFAAGANLLKVNARGNWWGTTEPRDIGIWISDLNDAYTSTTVPTVDYSGYLDGTGGNAVPGVQLLGAFTATSTTLTAGATYEVLSTITVPSGNTLIIPAGTVLRLHNAAALFVDGTLRIQGNAGSRARLTSGATAPANGDWTGIVVRNAAATLEIDFAEIEYAVRGVDVQGATVAIRDSLIHRFSTAGIAMNATTVATQISGNTIDNYTLVGEGISLTNASAAIIGNRITRTNRGIYMAGTSRPVVTSNVITENKWGVYLYGASSTNPDAVPRPTINGNDIYGNTTGQIEVNAYGVGNPVLVDATGNWWGTASPTVGAQVRLTGGTLLNVLDFGDPSAGSLTFDGSAPSTPSQLSAVGVSASQIALIWSSSSDDFGPVQYSIERCAGAACEDFAEITTVTTTNHTDTGLTSGATYRYRVQARDGAGFISGYSPVAVGVAAADEQAPTAPTALDAASMSSTQIDLRWVAANDNIAVISYSIERCEGAACSNYVEIATIAANLTTFRNTGLSAASTYRYRVRARDSVRFGGYSNVDAATTSITGADCD